MKINELVNLLKDYYPLYSLYDADEIMSKHATLVAYNLYPEEHRWYESSTNVYECEDGYIGITGPSELYCEHNTWKDIDEPCFASEFIAVHTITYKQKA